MPRDTVPNNQPIGYLERYLIESRQPLTSLVFVSPLVVLYEVGVAVLGSRAARNGADVWLRTLLDWLDLGHYLFLPALTVGLLLAWHHLRGDPWRVSQWVLCVMVAECVLVSAVLLGIAHLQSSLTQRLWSVALSGLAWPHVEPLGTAARIVGYCGAGIYEEVLFRLLLIPPLLGLLKLWGAAPLARIVTAVVITSALFALAHYVGRQGDSFAWFSFVFRFLAGSLFALLFVYRGFGIAAGSHALYDIVAGLF